MPALTTTLLFDLGEIGEHEVDVEFDYQPAEKQTYWEPGFNEEVDITSIKWEGVQLLPLLSADQIANLEATILMNRESDAADYYDTEFDWEEAA